MQYQGRTYGIAATIEHGKRETVTVEAGKALSKLWWQTCSWGADHEHGMQYGSYLIGVLKGGDATAPLEPKLIGRPMSFPQKRAIFGILSGAKYTTDVFYLVQGWILGSIEAADGCALDFPALVHVRPLERPPMTELAPALSFESMAGTVHTPTAYTVTSAVVTPTPIRTVLEALEGTEHAPPLTYEDPRYDLSAADRLHELLPLVTSIARDAMGTRVVWADGTETLHTADGFYRAERRRRVEATYDSIPF